MIEYSPWVREQEQLDLKYIPHDPEFSKEIEACLLIELLLY